MVCPYCTEQIQDTAKKCRFCGEWLAEADKRPGTNALERGSVDARAVAKGLKEKEASESAMGCLVFLLLVFCVIIFQVVTYFLPTYGWYVFGGLCVLFIVGMAKIMSKFYQE